MKAKPVTKSASPFRLVVADQDVTDDPPPSVLAIVSGLTNEALAHVPDHQLSGIIGELERMKAALTARLTAPRAARTRDDGPEWIDAAEVARRYSLPKSYVEELARKGELPSEKIGKYRRFRVADVKVWDERRKQEG